MKELGLRGNQTSTPKACETCVNKTVDLLIKRHGNNILTYFKIFLNDENKSLPSIYWLPKLHNSSTKARFITAAPKCSLKPLSLSITSVFKCLNKLRV